MWRVRATLPTIAPLLVASLPGPLFLIWVTTYHQLSLSPDSANYISAANSLREGALIAVDGSPYVYWPPMLPWVLALLSFAGISTIRAAAIINASSWFGAAFISGVWLRNVDWQPSSGVRRSTLGFHFCADFVCRSLCMVRSTVFIFSHIFALGAS